MKMLAFFIILLNLQICFAEALLLKADLDPKEIALPSGYKLWSQVQADNIKNRLMRDEVLNYSSLFLDRKVSNSDFIQFLASWSDSGFNEQERIVLADTLQKSNLPTAQKNLWLCRIDLERNCNKIKIFPKHLSALLQKFDWLIIDGQTYPRMSWDEISIPDESLTWIFLSSRFETYSFKGKWEELKFKNPVLADWISGHCDNFTVHPEVQSLDNNILLNRNCLKSSLVKPTPAPSFYDKNKKSIWIAAGLVIGAGAFNTFSGNKIILEKPSFR